MDGVDDGVSLGMRAAENGPIGEPAPDRLAAFRTQLSQTTFACRYPDCEEIGQEEEGSKPFSWYARADLRRHRSRYTGCNVWLWHHRIPPAGWPPALPVEYPPTAPDLARCWAEKLATEARVAFARELAVIFARQFPREVIIRVHLEVFWGEGR